MTGTVAEINCETGEVQEREMTEEEELQRQKDEEEALKQQEEEAIAQAEREEALAVIEAKAAEDPAFAALVKVVGIQTGGENGGQ